METLKPTSLLRNFRRRRVPGWLRQDLSPSVSPAEMRVVTDAGTFSEAREVELKGLAGTHTVYAVSTT